MRRIKIMVLVFTLLLGMVACRQKEGDTFALGQAELETGQEAKESNPTESKETIYVYVCGAVNCEGVYDLPQGSRVFEAVEAAGGFREDADKKEVNQAKLLKDEERIYVPAYGETVQSDAERDGKVNINRASKEELMTLPGVGASRADSIIQYRQEHGAFGSVEDIMQVSGIKEGLFNKIKDLITI